MRSWEKREGESYLKLLLAAYLFYEVDSAMLCGMILLPNDRGFESLGGTRQNPAST